MVTNGPWLTLEVNGQGPGAVLDLAPGDGLEARAAFAGRGADRVSLIGPDGVIAEADQTSEIRFETAQNAPTWIAAAARGGGWLPIFGEIGAAKPRPVQAGEWALSRTPSSEAQPRANQHAPGK